MKGSAEGQKRVGGQRIEANYEGRLMKVDLHLHSKFSKRPSHEEHWEMYRQEAQKLGRPL